MLVGNAIVGQSGGPTSAINATLAGVIRQAGKSEKRAGSTGQIQYIRIFPRHVCTAFGRFPEAGRCIDPAV